MTTERTEEGGTLLGPSRGKKSSTETCTGNRQRCVGKKKNCEQGDATLFKGTGRKAREKGKTSLLLLLNRRPRKKKQSAPDAARNVPYAF